MELNVKGMHCNSCKVLIEEVLEDEGASNVSVDWQKGKVRAEGISVERMKQLIQEEGYKVI